MYYINALQRNRNFSIFQKKGYDNSGKTTFKSTRSTYVDAVIFTPKQSETRVIFSKVLDSLNF